MTRVHRTPLAVAALALALLLGSATARTVTIATSAQPETLDPHVTSATSSFQTMKSIYDTLVEPDQNGVIVPGLAHSWTVSEDGLTLAFALREGVLFHDGSELDSADVAATIARLQADGSPKANEFEMIVDVATPDAYTVELTLDAPAPALLDSFASGWGAIVPAERIEAEHDFGNSPIGTGPYVFEEWVRDSFVRLSANPDYYAGAPEVEEVVIRYVSDTSVQFQGLQTGEFDIAVDVAAVDWPTIEGDPRFVLEQGPSGLVLVSALNTRRPYLEDPRVRQALNLAVDSDTVMEVAYGGGFPVGTFMEAGSPWLPETIEPYGYDPERARALLQEAGVPDDWTLDMALPQPYDTHITAGQVIQDMLGDVGVNVEIRIVEWGVWLGDVYGGPRDFDMTVIGHTGKLDASGRLGGYGHPDRTYHGYDNPEVAEMVQQAAVITDPGERAELYASVLTALHEEPPFIYIGTPYTTFARAADVDGFWITPLLDTFDLRSLRTD